jgi:polyisoprenoid-binding protein YceI
LDERKRKGRRLRAWTWGVVALGCALPGVVLGALHANSAKVVFTCSGPGGLRIEGTGTELLAEDKAGALVVTVPLASVTTGMSLRDTHMHEKYLESAKYPNAELSVPRTALKFPSDGSSIEATAAGTMSIHGTSRPVSFHYKAQRSGAAYDVQGDVHVNMNDYGITTPSYLGITVKPPVDVAVSFRLLDG